MYESLNTKQIELDTKLINMMSNRWDGISRSEIAKEFNITLEQVDEWISRLQKEGNFIWEYI